MRKICQSEVDFLAGVASLCSSLGVEVPNRELKKESVRDVGDAVRSALSEQYIAAQKTKAKQIPTTCVEHEDSGDGVEQLLRDHVDQK